MSGWMFRQKYMVEPQTVSFAARPLVGGCELTVRVKFATNSWGHEERLLFIPTWLKLGFECSGASLPLGTFPAWPGSIVNLFDHASSAEIQYSCAITVAQLREIERARDGRPFRTHLSMYADGFLDGVREEGSAYVDHWADVNRDEWLQQVVAGVGLHETVVLEVPLFSPAPDLEAAVNYLRAAVADQQRGGSAHADAVGKCRTALDAIEQAGFGAKAPQDVHTFIKQRAQHLTLQERLGAVHAALKMYFSPPHHPGGQADEMNRVDSNFALAVTASMILLSARVPRTPPSDDQ